MKYWVFDLLSFILGATAILVIALIVLFVKS